jgi:hypothetical protein
MFKEQEPIREIKEGHGGETVVKVTHPAFGAISTSRPSCGGEGMVLFGSDIGHQHFVSITLKEAHLEQHLGRDWINTGKVIAEFHLSEAQWAKFVSCGGRGSATPVTLDTYRDGEELTHVPAIQRNPESRKDQFDRDFKEKLEKAMEKISCISNSLQEMCEGKVTKSELRVLSGNLSTIVKNLPSNLDFAVDSFKEITETFVEDAKAEVEAYTLNALHVAGAKALEGFQDPGEQLRLERRRG